MFEENSCFKCLDKTEELLKEGFSFMRIWPEKPIFLGVVLVLVQQFGFVLGMALKFHSSVAKGLKLNFRKFWGLIPTFGEVAGEKLRFCNLDISSSRSDQT